MGNSRRSFLLTFVVQLLLMTDAEGSHGNQTCDLLDAHFKMLEMINNIIELKLNVNQLQSTNQALRSDFQQLHRTNQALSSDFQQLLNTNQALRSDVQRLENTTKEIIDSKVQGSQG